MAHAEGFSMLDAGSPGGVSLSQNSLATPVKYHAATATKAAAEGATLAIRMANSVEFSLVLQLCRLRCREGAAVDRRSRL